MIVILFSGKLLLTCFLYWSTHYYTFILIFLKSPLIIFIIIPKYYYLKLWITFKKYYQTWLLSDYCRYVRDVLYERCEMNMSVCMLWGVTDTYLSSICYIPTVYVSSRYCARYWGSEMTLQTIHSHISILT